MMRYICVKRHCNVKLLMIHSILATFDKVINYLRCQANSKGSVVYVVLPLSVENILKLLSQNPHMKTISTLGVVAIHIEVDVML